MHERRDAKEVNSEKEREIYACGGRLKLRVREEDGKKKKKKLTKKSEVKPPSPHSKGKRKEI